MIFPALRASTLLPVLLLVVPTSAARVAPAAATTAVSPAAIAARQEPEGKSLYLEHCKSCHGVMGTPTKTALRKYDKIPDLSERAFFAKRSDDSLLVVLRKGAGRDMKSFSDKMSADELRAVAKYIRTLGKKG